MFFSSLFQTEQPNVTARLTRLERKIDLVLQHLGITYEDKLADRVLDEYAAKSKIYAIKLYREETGAGLAEAKEAVEAIIAGREP